MCFYPLNTDTHEVTFVLKAQLAQETQAKPTKVTAGGFGFSFICRRVSTLSVEQSPVEHCPGSGTAVQDLGRCCYWNKKDSWMEIIVAVQCSSVPAVPSTLQSPGNCSAVACVHRACSRAVFAVTCGFLLDIFI